MKVFVRKNFLEHSNEVSSRLYLYLVSRAVAGKKSVGILGVCDEYILKTTLESRFIKKKKKITKKWLRQLPRFASCWFIEYTYWHLKDQLQCGIYK